MLLDLESTMLIRVKILQGKYKGQSIPLAASVEDLLNDGLPLLLINANVFDSICHPCDYYEVESVSYIQP